MVIQKIPYFLSNNNTFILNQLLPYGLCLLDTTALLQSSVVKNHKNTLFLHNCSVLFKCGGKAFFKNAIIFLAHQNRRFRVSYKYQSGILRRPASCVNNHLLLWNCWADLPQIWSVSSLWQSLFNLLMPF
jgi:hypothetical protein